MGARESWEEQREANRQRWDERVPLHVGSRFYDVDGFRTGRCSLQPFEREELGDVDGLELLHLQCHFGLDTLSWARRGARVTGLDFSAPAIAAARALAGELAIDARFVEADVYAATDTLGEGGFDVVYTGHGALCWLPDLDRWADAVARLLRPGGRLYLAEFHPLAETMADGAPEIVRSQFEHAGQRYEDSGTYTDVDAPTRNNVGWEWTHGLGVVVTALARRGFRIASLHERPTTLFARFPDMVRDEDGVYHQPEGRPAVPLSYSLLATLPEEER
jgi:SAM-dependent methyltransferase